MRDQTSCVLYWRMDGGSSHPVERAAVPFETLVVGLNLVFFKLLLQGVVERGWRSHLVPADRAAVRAFLSACNTRRQRLHPPQPRQQQETSPRLHHGSFSVGVGDALCRSWRGKHCGESEREERRIARRRGGERRGSGRGERRERRGGERGGTRGEEERDRRVDTESREWRRVRRMPRRVH